MAQQPARLQWIRSEFHHADLHGPVHNRGHPHRALAIEFFPSSQKICVRMGKC